MADRYGGRSPLRRGPPPRDRAPPRDRDDHPDVEYFGAGESYRPGGQTGDGPYRPIRDRENDRWNNDRRGRDRDRDRDRERERDRERRRDDIDSYIPPTSIRARNRSRSPPPYRRRSRTPPTRGRTELFPERTPRSPARRYSPPRDDRPRSPVRRRSRSPYNARPRSPDSKRPRDFSPDGRRSPKRERFDSPRRFDDQRRPISPDRGSYRPRSRSPPRRPNYAGENWRRRSPSPRESGATSRRSSPPPLSASRPQSPMRDRPRYDEDLPGRPRSPRREEYADRDDRSRDGEYPPTTAGPPTGPRGSRPPPSGPSRSYNASPPTGPASLPQSQSRPTAPPAGPRAAGQPPRDFTSPPGAMRGRTSLTYRAPGYRPTVNPSSSFDAAPLPTPTPPSGPRASSYSSRDFNATPSRAPPTGPSSRPASTYQPPTEFPFRGSSSSTTYPRSQRFNTSVPSGPSSVTATFNGAPPSATSSPVTPGSANFVRSQLNTLERVVPGGRHTPGAGGLSVDQERRMKQLEEDTERVRLEIAEKQKLKRAALTDWEVKERESEIAGLRSQLADEHLRTLGEEDVSMVGAAF